jgi:hypothetical protein
MFVVEKNNDNKFTFDDRSALLKYKTPYSPRSRLHDPSTRVASGSRIRPLASFEGNRSIIRQQQSIKKASSRKLQEEAKATFGN